MHASVTAHHINNNLQTTTKRKIDQVDIIPPKYLFAHAMSQITKVFHLVGIPIQILAQCNHFKSKHLNILTCNITQYHSILLLLI
jgi:hypothetical protein